MNGSNPDCDVTMPLFMQDGVISHTAKETVRFLNEQQGLTLLQSNLWPPKGPDLSPVDFCIWSVLEPVA